MTDVALSQEIVLLKEGVTSWKGPEAKVWRILEREGRQHTWPGVSKRIREGGDAVREKGRGWTALPLKEWVFEFCFRQPHGTITLYYF